MSAVPVITIQLRRYFASIVVVLAVLPSIACRSSRPSPALVESALRARIKGAQAAQLNIATVQKVDGQARNESGIEEYRMQFTANAVFLSDQYYLYLSTPQVPSQIEVSSTGEPECKPGWVCSSIYRYARAAKGTRLHLVGAAELARTENGWNVTGVDFAIDTSVAEATVERGQKGPNSEPAGSRDSRSASSPPATRPAEAPHPVADYHLVWAFDSIARQRQAPLATRLAKIDALRAKGLDLNGSDSQGQTPVRSIMDAGAADLVGPLVARGLSLDSSLRGCRDQYWYAQSIALSPGGLSVLDELVKHGFKEDCLKDHLDSYQGFVCGVTFGSGAPEYDVRAAVAAVEHIAKLGFNVNAKCLKKTIPEWIEGDTSATSRQRLLPLATAVRRYAKA